MHYCPSNIKYIHTSIKRKRPSWKLVVLPKKVNVNILHDQHMKKCQLKSRDEHKFSNIWIFKYFVPQINIHIWIITFMIFKYIFKKNALWSKYILKYLNSSFFFYFPKNVIFLVHIFLKFTLVLNKFEYLFKLWPQKYLNICLWRFQSFE